MNTGGAGSNESSLANLSKDKPIPVSNSYLPYKIARSNYSLTLVDRDIIKRLRPWLSNHFRNEYQYERNLLMPLSKVRDAINGVMVLGTFGPAS